jgi:hypothetical protein
MTDMGITFNYDGESAFRCAEMKVDGHIHRYQSSLLGLPVGEEQRRCVDSPGGFPSEFSPASFGQF